MNLNEQILSELLIWLKTFGEFTSEQVPLVVQEAILYGRFICTFLILLSLAISVICIFYVKKGIKKLSICSYPDESHWWFIILLNTALGFVSLLCFCATIENFFKVWLAPRLYLLSYLERML